MSVYFNASRDKEYDRGGEEILKYDRLLINAGIRSVRLIWTKHEKKTLPGEGLNPNTGVFTCPVGGTYMFLVHLATHKDKVDIADSNRLLKVSCRKHYCLSARMGWTSRASWTRTARTRATTWWASVSSWSWTRETRWDLEEHGQYYDDQLF